ncbi:MAG: ComF family protein [Alphaproteobacteria bacterium]|nr:ComF family protein [Alphaproteobacteria bacterium]
MDEEVADVAPKFQFADVRRGFSLAMGRVVDLIVPPKCLVCHQSVTIGASLCVACWQKLNFIEHPICDVMGTPFAYDQGIGTLSAAALAAPPPWDKARAAVVFDDHSKGLVHALKYKDHHEAALFMVRLMARAGRDVLAASDLVVPVPLHPSRLWKRRFNQAALLAKPLAAGAGKPYGAVQLLRKVATRQQVGLKQEAREKNVRKAFAIAEDLLLDIKDRTVLVVDDVRTTGATAAACAEALKVAGAAQVFVLSFALVLEPHRFHIEA